LNGNITASGSSYDAGIGAGQGVSERTSFAGTLSIFGGRITVNGTMAGIGSGGESGEVKLTRFSGNPVLTCNANISKFPISASSIVLSNVSVMFTTPRNQLFGVGPSSSNWKSNCSSVKALDVLYTGSESRRLLYNSTLDREKFTCECSILRRLFGESM
jgi:hypothetical protein